MYVLGLEGARLEKIQAPGTRLLLHPLEKGQDDKTSMAPSKMHPTSPAKQGMHACIMLQPKKH